MTRQVTLKDIALRAGVSTAAISQALNDRGSLRLETRERIKAIAAELGYQPNKYAAALRSGRTMSVGFVLPEGIELDLSRRSALHRSRHIGALVSAAAQQGFTVTMLPASRPDLLRGAQIDVVYFAEVAADDLLLREAVIRGIPVATNDLYVDTERSITVRTGYDEAVRAALGLLEAGGAQRIGFLVDDAGAPRDRIGESAYRAWSTVRGRTPLVAHVDAEHGSLPRRVGELRDAGADAIFSFAEEGPAIYLQLEEMDFVIPRDMQFVALCTTDCAVNSRLGVTHVCVHPELAPAAMFEALSTVRDGVEPDVVDLPWEIIRGSSTR
ncbi:LacI family DNA-binding transcriptional regulator [Microbacterium thalli]|uniref:LacI family DNA-binding transcriptional regulator n=1 Tax=Microbacterium thalli TaxID=3027921 RepID=UPI0023653C9C|nr:LacI family DNA-binding transcriptional regulator [Microbacterium thalli]MDD7929439.1 LacI family DNA-binding transcriptional regulator [Microbacterium thalli]